MRGAVRQAVMLLGMAAGAALLAAVIAPAGVTSGPYRSALSDLAAGQPARAASRCADRTCSADGTRCVHVNGSHTNCGIGDFCRTLACQ
ncbi:MAG TPA: hypothetical protein VFT43_00260 [Candidatus Polarisedimenticolia bacterium]|nr:hypothetical protein [Candidatus Polarisedimenticolia bacterium]